MHSVILNREYAMKFIMLSIFSPFTTSFKFWARFASHVISYLTDVTSVPGNCFSYLVNFGLLFAPKVFVATCKPTLFTITQIHKCCAFQECIENINQCRHHFKMWMLENLNSRASFLKMAGELKIVLLKGSRRVLRRVSSICAVWAQY